MRRWWKRYRFVRERRREEVYYCLNYWSAVWVEYRKLNDMGGVWD